VKANRITMPAENTWIVENRVMLTRLSGHITIEDMQASARRGTAMIETGTAPVYSLVDASQIEHFPLKLNELKSVTDEGSSDKLGWIIIYGIPNRLLSFLATTFAQLIGKNYKVVNTQDEALAFIAQQEGRPIHEA
jgi:hypothetical protein